MVFICPHHFNAGLQGERCWQSGTDNRCYARSRDATGESILGSKKNGLPVIVEDGVAKLMDRSSFAGSVATTDMLVRNMISLGGVSLTDAIIMMTQTPAMIMGVGDRKGTLEKGKDATY